MRRLYANKLVVISAVLIVLFSALFALVRSSARSPLADKMATPDVALNPLAAQGRALFESRCASCHSLQEGARPLAPAADEAVARSRLLTFLEGHGHSSAAENPAIVEFLAYTARAGRPQVGRRAGSLN